MEKLEGKIDAWLRDHLIPRLAGIFRESSSGGDPECMVTRPKGSFFLSSLFFASIRFPGSAAGGSGQRHVLIKLPSQDPTVRSNQNYAELFANEMLFYESVAPSLPEDYPVCYLSGDDPICEKVIVLENVSTRGFSTSPHLLNVNLDYVIAGLRAIARFHGNTYAMKEQAPKKFHQILKDIINVRYKEDPVCVPYKEHVNSRIKRVVRTLRKRGYDPDFTEQMASLFEDCFANVLLRCVRPVEPLATIIHGDCTINNVLFQKIQYGTDGYLKAMLVDFAMILYSMPSIDIATFVYMSCSREDIKERSEDLFKAYHDCLTEYLQERDIWNPATHSYEALWTDYKRRAVFGYVIGTYFLPMMTEYARNNEILDLDRSLLPRIDAEGGGEALSNLLVDMLIDMREAGLLDWLCK